MIKNNDKDIERFENILKQIEKSGLRSISSDEVLEFGKLYRMVVSELSTARSHNVNNARILYLNQLISRSYGYLYVEKSKGLPSIKNFFYKDFPQTFRKTLRFTLFAFIVTMIAALFAFSVVSKDPGKADVVMGPGASESMDSIAQRHEGKKNWMPEEMRPVMSAYVMTNNIKVSAIAFSTGIAAGIGTFGILFQNGIMLGVIGAAVKSRGPNVMLGFWAFVAPHGIIELTAIFIAGGAGFLLGWSVLNPGQYSRGAAIKLAARDAFILILGVAAMLVIAGIVEGFISPSMLPESVKFALAAILGILQFNYLFRVGKSRV